MKINLQKIVDVLHGKKGILIGLIAVVNIYLAKQGVISANAATLIQGIVSLLGAGADIVTNQIGVTPSVSLGSSRRAVVEVKETPKV